MYIYITLEVKKLSRQFSLSTTTQLFHSYIKKHEMWFFHYDINELERKRSFWSWLTLFSTQTEMETFDGSIETENTSNICINLIVRLTPLPQRTSNIPYIRLCTWSTDCIYGILEAFEDGGSLLHFDKKT